MSMKSSRYIYGILVFGVLLGALATTLVRFISYKSDVVHYHANFAIIVNGEREIFKGPGYYEEVAKCSSDNQDDPAVRTHLHDNNPGLVHVHAHAVTWGQLFDNLGVTASTKTLSIPMGTYIDGQEGSKLSYWLNGKPIDYAADKLIKSGDVLLINFGPEEDAILTQRFSQVPRDAHDANVKNDPSTCSGSHAPTFGERLKKALGY